MSERVFIAPPWMVADPVLLDVLLDECIGGPITILVLPKLGGRTYPLAEWLAKHPTRYPSTGEPA